MRKVSGAGELIEARDMERGQCVRGLNDGSGPLLLVSLLSPISFAYFLGTKKPEAS